MKRRTWAAVAGTLTLAVLAATFWWPRAADDARGPAATVLGWQAQPLLLAGDGLRGDRDGPSALARFDDPWGVAIDTAGTVYVADAGDNNRIRRRWLDGQFHTVAGSVEGFADGQGRAARFHTPSGLALDRHGNLYIADTGNHAIRRMTPGGVVTTVAGNGQPGDDDGPAQQARFNGPMGVAVDADGRIFVADTWNDRIRVIDPDGQVRTLAGSGQPGHADGAGALAQLDTPTDVALATDGSVWVADHGNNALRRIDRHGVVSTPVGGPQGTQTLAAPLALALTHDGMVYVTERRGGRLMQVSPQGHLLALTDPAVAGHFSRPAGVAVVGDGSVLLTDADAHRVHHLVPRVPGQPAALAAVGPAADNPLPDNQRRWPLAPQLGWHEVVGTLGEVRGNFRGESRSHLHAGFDVRGDVGQTVLAVADGKVSSPAATWSFGGQAEGLSLGVLDYLHMKVGRDAANRVFDDRFALLRDDAGKPVRVRVRRGTRFSAGEPLGTINNQAHVHLVVGPAGYERNAVRLGFANYADHHAPRIDDIALLDAGDNRLLADADGEVAVSRDGGPLQIVVEAWDQVDHNLPRRRLGLYALGFQILDRTGTPLPGYEAPVMNIEFNRMPPQRDAVKVAYAADSGITVHGSARTRFRYVVSNVVRDGRSDVVGWQPHNIPSGAYVIRITARDYSGNVATGVNDLRIRVH